MSLIKCPECGQYVSEFAESCPKCGCPRNKMIELLLEEQRRRKSHLPSFYSTLDDEQKSFFKNVGQKLRELKRDHIYYGDSERCGFKSLRTERFIFLISNNRNRQKTIWFCEPRISEKKTELFLDQYYDNYLEFILKITDESKYLTLKEKNENDDELLNLIALESLKQSIHYYIDKKNVAPIEILKVDSRNKRFWFKLNEEKMFSRMPVDKTRFFDNKEDAKSYLVKNQNSDCNYENVLKDYREKRYVICTRDRNTFFDGNFFTDEENYYTGGRKRTIKIPSFSLINEAYYFATKESTIATLHDLNMRGLIALDLIDDEVIDETTELD